MEHRLAALAILIMLLLAACGGRSTPLTNDGEVNLADPNVGGGAGIILPNETPGALPGTASPATSELAPRATSAPASAKPSPPAIAPTAVEPSPQPSATEAAAEASPKPDQTDPAEPTATPAEADATADATAVGIDATAVSTAATAEATTAARPTTHIVQAGENLYRIGLLYGISYVALAEYNGISDFDAVAAGQELRIPPVEDAAEEPAATESTATAVPTVAEAVTPESATAEPGTPEAETAAPAPAGTSVAETPTAERTHTVQPGENLYRISQEVGVNWALIAEANGLISPNQIVVGQVLKIPSDAPGPAIQFTHQVHAGESLFRIALQYGVPLAALAEANGLQVTAVIYPGQVLVIPSQ